MQHDISWTMGAPRASYLPLTNTCPHFVPNLGIHYPFNKTFGWGDWDPNLHQNLGKMLDCLHHECYKKENKNSHVAS